MKPTRLINVRFDLGYSPEPYVYIGRKSGQLYHYGNPFRMRTESERDQVCSKFDLWLKGESFQDFEPVRRNWILLTIGGLRGSVLGCHCIPKRCHGHTLIQWADADYCLAHPQHDPEIFPEHICPRCFDLHVRYRRS